MINFILWLILGGVAGWIASKIMNTDAQMGVLANIVVGIIGAFLGGYLVGMLTGADVQELSVAGLLTAVLGSVILLAIVKAFTGRSTRKI